MSKLRAETRSTNSEIRSKSKIQIVQTLSPAGSVSNFEVLSFVLVSDFDIRISILTSQLDLGSERVPSKETLQWTKKQS
jgi:hypothetical protein